jgi:hypothetical protein
MWYFYSQLRLERHSKVLVQAWMFGWFKVNITVKGARINLRQVSSEDFLLDVI